MVVAAENTPCRVLIVDRSEETCEVLQTVLERRGVRTLAVGKPEKGLELAKRYRPELIVLDLESCRPDAPPAFYEADESLPSHDRRLSPHLVLLGTLRDRRNRPTDGEFVAKPYHYGPLIRRIEELLKMV
jgi:CheY-like chemotaxis protein